MMDLLHRASGLLRAVGVTRSDRAPDTRERSSVVEGDLLTVEPHAKPLPETREIDVDRSRLHAIVELAEHGNAGRPIAGRSRHVQHRTARTRLDRQVPADDASAPTRRAGNVVAERIPGTQLRIRCEESWQALSEESAM